MKKSQNSFIIFSVAGRSRLTFSFVCWRFISSTALREDFIRFLRQSFLSLFSTDAMACYKVRIALFVVSINTILKEMSYVYIRLFRFSDSIIVSTCSETMLLKFDEFIYRGRESSLSGLNGIFTVLRVLFIMFCRENSKL